MSDFLIKILFKLLGNNMEQQYSIGYLFGASTQNHEGRKKRWEKALASVWRNKDFIDFLHYQCESDKENVWRGKIDKKLAQGARVRTMFIVKQAHLAYLNRMKANGGEAQRLMEDKSKVGKAYKELTDISTVDN